MKKEYPYLPANEAAYQDWRSRKLDELIQDASDLVVELNNPEHPTQGEIEAIRERCNKVNMAIYTSNRSMADNRKIPLRLGECIGLRQLEANLFADDDGVTSLAVNDQASQLGYIPYTNNRLHWHTDGFYNLPDRQIGTIIIHCVRPATQGGENRLIDHELVYIMLRDKNPASTQALMTPDVMRIPAYVLDNREIRPVGCGPVYSIHPQTGHLQMRYTGQKEEICWKEDPATQQAVAALESLLDSMSSTACHIRLEPGMGIIANNVLHDRSGFEDAPGNSRLLYRSRYYDRVP